MIGAVGAAKRNAGRGNHHLVRAIEKGSRPNLRDGTRTPSPDWYPATLIDDYDVAVVVDLDGDVDRDGEWQSDELAWSHTACSPLLLQRRRRGVLRPLIRHLCLPLLH